ncbi:MAG: Eco57I restriction-modification methylase domain-containing protein [Candidatus Hydrogenedentes bacterium]|nr:Eco57I restriction-modification methylase domain-containing protein [Candidatus Hydrogenedentota bacterium]
MEDALETPKTVLDLIERFHEHLDRYRSPEYNEAQVRREFIDPLFEALGWDVQNKKGYAEPYKEVVHEDSIKVGGVTKAPDYSFRIGGRRLFFLEAKKPFINLKEDPSPAYQLRRYAWTAKLPVSILTDFEEFIVYDTRVKPEQNDKASTARVLYIPYTEYADRWSEIAALFTPQAIQKGPLDKYVESKARRRGTAEVDDAFLAEIEEWRDLLARNIALRNPGLKQRELNFAVQLTIDRIIFLRICEDRGIENFAQLQALLNGTDIYARLRYHFERADERYNSGLFHFHKERDRAGTPDTLTPKLNIDDKVLKAIIRRLYYPESPYEFSVFPAEILGHVYERFLGSVICLSPGGRATVEQKPEVRKAGGVYYTPTYIVEYIVKHTVGKLLEGKTPQEVAGCTETWRPAKGAHALAILDPACGSGSFLLGAYQYLLDWHLQYYSQDASKWSKGKEPRIFQYHRGGWRLTTMERKRILLANIYGVDIDTQAVEVTKLSLLLKVLEGENSDSLQQQLSLLHQRALPDLANNIKCGNSLIGPDFYQGQQLDAFDEEEQYRINAFDWNAEFAAIMKSGGFDAVIGNPPYIRMEAFQELKDYLRTRFKTHDERSDLYVYFIEREHALLRSSGMFGMIVSNKFLRANYGRRVRGLLLDVASLRRIVDLAGLPVFPGATVRTVILITQKTGVNDSVLYSPPPERATFDTLSNGGASLDEVSDTHTYKVPSSAFVESGWDLSEPEKSAFIKGLRAKGRPLIDVVGGRICMGIKSGLTEAFVISRQQRDSIVRKNRKADEILRPFLQGRNIRRYRLEPSDEYLVYTYHGIDMRGYPAVLEHLRPFRKRLEGRATRQAWYELQQPQYAYVKLLEGPKLVFPDIATGCRFAFDGNGYFGANTVYFLPTENLPLLALLNSRLAHCYFIQTCAALEGPGESYLRFFGQYLEQFPVLLPAPTNARHHKITSLVRRMLDLNKRLKDVKTDHARTVLERQIAATDNDIDRLVYELYGLTDDEIAIVEESSG